MSPSAIYRTNSGHSEFRKKYLFIRLYIIWLMGNSSLGKHLCAIIIVCDFSQSSVHTIDANCCWFKNRSVIENINIAPHIYVVASSARYMYSSRHQSHNSRHIEYACPCRGPCKPFLRPVLRSSSRASLLRSPNTIPHRYIYILGGPYGRACWFVLQLVLRRVGERIVLASVAVCA